MAKLSKENIENVLSSLKEAERIISELANSLQETKSEEQSYQTKEAEKSVTGIAEKDITDFIVYIGIPAHLKGYNYIRAAVKYVLENSKDSLSNCVYPAVAEEFHTTPSRVERAIRHAVRVTWNRRDAEVLKENFGSTINPKKGRPTNREFIATVVDLLKRKSS